MTSNFFPDEAIPAKPERTPDYVRGQVLRGKYELLRPLDSGGMGVVWVARDRVLSVEVALKLMERPASERPEFTRRALSEARLAAKLAHPAVCRSMDFGVSDRGDPFVVSELLTGETLEERIGRAGSMEPVEAVQMLLPILDALGSAHELGIVHRDVKPGNIFLAKQWSQGIQPKLLDFGIARWVDESAAASEGICGTPCYMSPEQARGGGDVDARSDLWNFCATLYELVTGVPPFDGDTGAAVIAAVQCVDPPPITHFHAGDEELAGIIARGMHRNRDERWSSAQELAIALSRWLLAHGAETDGSGRALRARLGETQSGGNANIAPSSLTPSAIDVKAETPSSAPRVPQARFWLGVLAGAALVFPLTTFQVLRATSEADAAPAERLTGSLGIAAEPPPANVATGNREFEEDDLALTRLASTEVTPITDSPVAAPNAASPTPPRPVRSAPVTTASASAAAAPVASTPPSAPPARPVKTSKQPSNALGYDFGF